MRWPRLCRSVASYADERQVADVKSRGPGAPTLALSLWVMMIPKATVANKPGTPRRARYKRKPIAQGMPVDRQHLW